MAGKVAIGMKPTNAETNSKKNNDLIGQTFHVFLRRESFSEPKFV